MAMSGGVDSSVAAALLKESGYDVIGLHLKLYHGPENERRQKSCCSLDEALDARTVCERLDIPFYVIDFQQEFRENVIDYFVSEYARGRTPNPCVMCNRTIKSEFLLHKADELDCEFLATGHYAAIKNEAQTGFPQLWRPLDRQKDQTYFLHGIPANELNRLLFPLSNYIKPQVRKKAQHLHFASADKPDSQEICFVSRDYRDFLQRHLPSSTPGEFISTDGKVLGQHRGIAFYTVGQRRGLGISDATPYFVVELDPNNNRVILGKPEDLQVNEVEVTEVNWLLPAAPTQPFEALVQLRYAHKGCIAEVIPSGTSTVQLRLTPAERGVSPGQAAVFYDGDRVLGGGWIKACAPHRDAENLVAHAVA
jgi:tRNA-specific 2-thiouridylase